MSESKMTRYAFMEHMKDFMKELLQHPLKANTDDFLRGFGIDAPSALKMLLKRTDPNDEYSSIVIRNERIKDNGYDEDGKRNKDTFEITYKIPRKDFKKKLRNLYINLFEQNLSMPNTLKEGAWGYDILDNDTSLDYQTEFADIALNVLCSNVSNDMYGEYGNNANLESLWAHVGVLVDFLKKYKDDEIQTTDKYSYAIELVKTATRYLFNNDMFISSWSEPKKIKSSLKKTLKDVSLLKYQEDIMGSKYAMMRQATLNEDGEGGAVGGGAMEGMGGASTTFTTGDYTFDTPVNFGKKKGKDNVIRKTGSKQIYVTEDQIKYIKEATTTQDTGEYQFTVPMQGGQERFYDEALDHKNIMKKSFQKNK